MAAASTTIRVREQTRRALSELAGRQGRTIPEVVAELVERAAADAMFAAHNAEATVDDPGEQPELDSTLLDGLRDDPWPLDERGSPAR